MRKKVLVVDDARIMRKILGKYLDKTEYEVIGEAADGEEALRMCADLKPDLITLDIIMPKMDGLEVLKKLKILAPQIKIIVVTALSQQSLVQKALDLGAVDVITKPFSSEKIISAFKKLSKG